MPTYNSQVLYTGDGSTTGYSIPFSFIDSTHIKAYIDNVETTAFTISTSTLTFTSAPANGTTIKIERNTPIDARLVDFTDGSVLTEADLDKSADQNFFIAQETADDQENNLRLEADDKYNANSKVIKNVANPVNDNDAVNKTYLENTWLSATNKADLTTVANNISDINTVEDNITNINTVASDLNEATSEIDTVATNITNVNTVGNNITNVNTVASNDSNITTVAGNDTNITTVAGISANVTTVAGISSNVTSVANDATDIGTVATDIANVNSVATNISNVNSVASNETNINAVNSNATNINTVAGANSNITTLAGINSDITTVSGISANVTAVAGDATDIGTVATDIANVNSVATNIANVNSVAGNSTNINAVNSNSTNINAVASNATNINTVAGINSDITTLASISSDISTASTNASDIQAVADEVSKVVTVANDLTEATSEIDVVANNITNVNAVGTDITNVNTVATNLADVNSFAETYFISATAPSSPTVGDLWFDTTNSLMKVYTSGGFVNAGSSVNGTSERFKYTATASQTTFSGADDNGATLTYDAGYVDVYLNGIKLVNGTDFTASSGNSIVLTSGATVNDILDIVTYGTFELANFSINDANDVSTAGVTNGQVLAYNSTASEFQPTTVDLTNLSASNLTSGTIPDARFPSVLPAVDGSNLTGITSVTINNGADNRIITSSASANTLEAEANLVFDDTNKYLGIGQAVPSSDLHINRNGSDVGIRIQCADTTGTAKVQFGTQSDVVHTAIQFDASDNSLQFRGYDNSEDMRIDSSGNVGIGTSSPAKELHVYASSGESAIQVEANAGDAGINLKGYSTSASFVNFGDESSNNVGQIYYSHSNNSMQFKTNGSARMTIDSSGNLLPNVSNSYDLGSSSLVWRNIYTSDFHMSNEGLDKGNDIDGTKGSWTFQEGEENLYLINNKNGKKYKFNLTEIE